MWTKRCDRAAPMQIPIKPRDIGVLLHPVEPYNAAISLIRLNFDRCHVHSPAVSECYGTLFPLPLNEELLVQPKVAIS
jgi:hypothetical protein